MGDEMQKQIDELYTAIGFDLAEKENHLDLLVSTNEKKYFQFLVRTIPNVSNVDIIPLSNLACLLATFKRLNEYISCCDSNVELYLKLISKRNDIVGKIDMIFKSYGLNGTGRGKLVIPFEIEE